jgi:site-specific recombinase XerD
MKISEHKQTFIQEMERRGYRQNSIQNYSSCIDVFLSTIKKDHPKNINEQDIKNFLRSCVKANTQRNYHSAIKLFYDICLNQKQKFKNIPYTKVDKNIPIILSVEEIQKMFNVCENKKHKLMLALLYSCSLRVSELINLKWKDVDRSRMVIYILNAKGGKDRQVALNESLIKLMEDYYREYKTQSFIFSGQFGEKYSDRSVGQVIKQLAKKAGINKRVYTHLIRHCSASHLLDVGTDIHMIQRILGHSSVKTTSIYLHTSHTTISKIKSPLENISL